MSAAQTMFVFVWSRRSCALSEDNSGTLEILAWRIECGGGRTASACAAATTRCRRRRLRKKTIRSIWVRFRRCSVY